jgi:hypothetical protein
MKPFVLFRLMFVKREINNFLNKYEPLSIFQEEEVGNIEMFLQHMFGQYMKPV